MNTGGQPPRVCKSEPRDLLAVAAHPTLVQGLIDRGYSDAEIRRIIGENLLRVMRANEPVAREMAEK